MPQASLRTYPFAASSRALQRPSGASMPACDIAIKDKVSQCGEIFLRPLLYVESAQTCRGDYISRAPADVEMELLRKNNNLEGDRDSILTKMTQAWLTTSKSS